MTQNILLKADRLWDGVSPTLLHNAFLLVKNGKIEAIGKQGELGESGDLAAGAQVVELAGCTLMPGLINMHTHLTFNASQTVLNDYFREKEAGIATLTLRAVDNLRRSLRTGVTTIRDCGTLNEVIFPVRAAVESGLIQGPRVVASGTSITITGGHCYYFSYEADNADEVRKAVRAQAKVGADFIKIFASGGNLTPGSDPVESQYTAEELKAATAEARRLGKRVASHAHGSESVRHSVAARVTTIEHCTFMTSTSVEYEPDTADEIAQAGIYVVPTLNVNLTRRLAANPNFGKDSPKIMRYVETQQIRHENILRLHKNGVKVVSGSDSGIPGVFFDDFAEDLTLLVTQIGLNPQQALLTATSLAAEACGLEDTGQLKPGFRADLLAVSGNPLENINDLRNTHFVAVAGRVVA